MGRLGREILFFVVWGCRAARFFCCLCYVSDTSAERSLYIHGPRQTSAAKSSHIYVFKICGCIWLKFTCGQKESKPSKTHHVLLTVALVLLIWIRSISSISILMLLISISTVTGLISKTHKVGKRVGPFDE